MCNRVKLIEYDEKYGFSEEKLVDYEYELGDIAFEKVIG